MANAAENASGTLVLGANGKTGRRIMQRLRAAGLDPRPGSRRAVPAFEWTDQRTWGPVLETVTSAYVSYQPDLAIPGAVRTVTEFFERATASGVRKLVLLTGRGEPEAEAAEAALRSIAFDWTILRSSWFAQNFSEGHFLEPIRAGLLSLPVGQVAEPFVDVEDIAEIACAALTGQGHSHQTYEITGPKALTFAEATAEIASATGREIHSERIAATDFRTGLTDAGVPTAEIELILHLFTTLFDGRNTGVADGVERALGRPPRDFAAFARDTAASGIWSPDA